VLLRLARYLTVLQPATIARIRAYFESPAALAAFAGTAGAADEAGAAAAAAPQPGAEAGIGTAAAAGASTAVAATDAASTDAAAVSAAVQRWSVRATEVDSGGTCAACGGQLKAVDLDPPEYQSFLEGIALLAAKQEKHPDDFAKVSCAFVSMVSFLWV
jgi:hypothetical protein